MKERTCDRFRRQHGAISRSEALADGLSYRQVQQRVASGQRIVIHPGVYRHAAHAVTPEQQILAAVLSAGPGAVASHQAAAFLWGLLEWQEAQFRGSVTVMAPAHPRALGFDVHRSSYLDWGRVRVWRGIECTDPLWTMADLGAVAGGALPGRAIDRALANRLVTVEGLEAEIARRSKRGRPGIGVLRRHLATRGFVGAPHPSVLESRTRALLARYRIPVDRAEVVVGPDGEYRIDFCLVHPVMLEVDGYVWPFSPEHQDRDNERCNRLKLMGIDLYVTDGGRCTNARPTWRGYCVRPSASGVELQHHLDVGRLADVGVPPR